MEAKNLMVGDWVMYNPNVFIEDEYEPTKECYPIQIKNGEDIDLAIEDCYSPIPLTPEILEKNGFEQVGETYLFDDDYYDLQVKEYSDGNWLVVLEDCEFNLPHSQATVSYVHELQHALRLFGAEKGIKL